MPTLTRFAVVLLLALLLAPLGLLPQTQAAPAAQPEPLAPAQATPIELPPYIESETAAANNNAPATASVINSSAAQSWVQRVRGTVGSASDVDYFAFTLKQPASNVTLTLDGLTADYDLVLAGGPNPDAGFDAGQEGLEGITEIGSQISAIGSQISAIGSQISAIGSQISAIGSQISAIGSQISAISANSGSTPERIDTFLWLPGTYYAVVTASNGQFSDTAYNLVVQVDGSGLATPPAAPEVEIRGFTPTFPVTTLYIIHSDRMAELYGADLRSGPISSIQNSLNFLSSNPPSPNGAEPAHGYVIDLADLRPNAGLGFTETITQAYDRWDTNLGNPLYANYIAGLIDNVIEAVTVEDNTPGASSANPAFTVGTGGLIRLTGVKHVVLVGGDDVHPGFRLPDLTTIANEAEYAAYLRSIDPSGVIRPNSPQGAALRYRMITSDNPYGAGRPYKFYGFPFFLPRLAVARLVETPEEIAAYLRNYLPGAVYSPDFVIDLNSAARTNRSFVSGYDFLKDQASATALLLQAATAPLSLTRLINDEWTRSELERDWFNGKLDSEFSDKSANLATREAEVQLASVNAHFDHWQVLPAKPTNGNFSAERLLAPLYTPDGQNPDVPGGYFRTTLGYSVGCHSGFNVVALAIPGTIPNAVLYRADFAQAYNKHGGNWIGNTGYGYGTADGIDYSERLAVLLTQELMRDVREDPQGDNFYVGQSIGEALRNAKQRYVRNAASLSPYDYKILHIMTLYGLPFIRTNVEAPLSPPLEDERPAGESTPLQTQAPYTPSSVGRLTRTITFTLDLNDNDDFVTIPRTGSRVLTLSDDDITVEDEFVQRSSGRFPSSAARIFANNQVGAPVLPTFAYDISAQSAISDSVRLDVRDVVFVSGTYGALTNFDPQITQVTTETNTPIVATDAEPSFGAGAGRWYPDKFFGFSSVGEGDLARDQLAAAAAQFRADANGETGLLRPYAQMVFKVIYDDPGRTTNEANAIRADDQPPVIESVRIAFEGIGLAAQPAQSASARVVLTAYDEGEGASGSPNSGLDVLSGDISGVYVQNNRWLPLNFTPVPGSARRYSANLNVAQGDVRVIVRVTDRAGNTSYYTAKGSFQPPIDRNFVRLPLLRK